MKPQPMEYMKMENLNYIFQIAGTIFEIVAYTGIGYGVYNIIRICREG